MVSKGSYIIQHFFPAAEGVIPLLNAAGSTGDLLILAAGLAFRWDYRIRWYQAALGVAYVVLSSLLSAPSGSGIEMPLTRRVIGGSVLVAAGVAFWPWRSTATSPRGCRFLSISFGLWGLSRMATGFVDVPPDSMTYIILNSALALFYFLSVFAIIILVLERARGEVASLKEFNERLVDGLGEGLELVDGEFTIRHANRWMAEQFGPVVGRHCYEVLTADKRQCPGCPLARRDVMATPARLEITGPSDRRFLLTCSPVRQADGQVFLLELVSDVTEQERLRQPMRQMGDIGKVVEHVSALLQEERNGRAGVQVDVRVDPTIPQFAFDADQLTQVLWNIARNGVEAMQGRGHLTLNVGRHNGQVLISVADTGPGISPDEQRRIFQPFISKKPGGTGLGLAIAQRIVTAHGGRIDVESAPEQGSRFTIRLPVVEG